MCELVSFFVTTDERILTTGNLHSHERVDIVGLAPGEYREAEWTKDDEGESLVVRTEPNDAHNEAWYKSLVLARCKTRNDLVNFLTASKEFRGAATVYASGCTVQITRI